MNKNELKIAIINRSAGLAHKTDECSITTLEEYIHEYTQQFEDACESYNTWLRLWLSYMVEKGSKEAIEIMKDLIRYRLANSSRRV